MSLREFCIRHFAPNRIPAWNLGQMLVGVAVLATFWTSIHVLCGVGAPNSLGYALKTGSSMFIGWGGSAAIICWLRKDWVRDGDYYIRPDVDVEQDFN